MSAQSAQPGVSVSIRTRIIVAMVLVAGAALTVSGVLVSVLQQRALDSRAVDNLQRSKAALEHLIAAGTDPDTGGPLTDPSEIVRLHLSRAFWGPAPGRSASSTAHCTGCPPRSRACAPRTTRSSWPTWRP